MTPIRVSEADLQRLIVDAADAGGWLVFHDNDSRRNRAGFPDLVLVRGRELLMLELKSQNGRVRPDQQLWMDELNRVEVMTAAIVRPDDADGLIARLTRRG